MSSCPTMFQKPVLLRVSKSQDSFCGKELDRYGPTFTKHSREHSWSFFSRFCEFECNTTSDWLNYTV